MERNSSGVNKSALGPERDAHQVVALEFRQAPRRLIGDNDVIERPELARPELAEPAPGTTLKTFQLMW